MFSPEHHDSVTSDQQLIESSRPKQSSRTSSFEIENLLKTAEQVTTYCRSPQETRKSSPTGSVTSSAASNAVMTPSRQLTDAEKLRKVTLELVDTERAYVKVRELLAKLQNDFNSILLITYILSTWTIFSRTTWNRWNVKLSSPMPR